jgi:hypothetical protein
MKECAVLGFGVLFGLAGVLSMLWTNLVVTITDDYRSFHVIRA